VLDHPQADHTRQLLADLPGLSALPPDHNSTGIPSVRLGGDANDSPTLSTTEGTSSIPS
jgi:hypothetical protein